jgi:hypothetical protein
LPPTALASSAKSPGTFETPPLLPVVDESIAFATDVTAKSAIFNGFVNPGNGATSYHFAYGLQAGHYTNVLPDVGIGSVFSPVPVEQAIPPGSLTSGTTYHFALTAHNAAGTVTGAEETFTTASLGTPPETAPVLSTTPVSDITQTGAVVGASIDSGGLAATFELELGSDLGYATQIFGGTTAPEKGPQLVSFALSDLPAATVFDYRVCATDQNGKVCAENQSFRTLEYPNQIAQPISAAIIPFIAPSEVSVSTKGRSTRSQKLARAIQVCKAERPRSRRVKCRARAHKRYGASSRKTTHK